MLMAWPPWQHIAAGAFLGSSRKEMGRGHNGKKPDKHKEENDKKHLFDIFVECCRKFQLGEPEQAVQQEIALLNESMKLPSFPYEFLGVDKR